MSKIKEVLLSADFKRFYWNTLNGFIGLTIIYVSGINWVYAPMVIAICNGITKVINNKIQK